MKKNIEKTEVNLARNFFNIDAFRAHSINIEERNLRYGRTTALREKEKTKNVTIIAFGNRRFPYVVHLKKLQNK